MGILDPSVAQTVQFVIVDPNCTPVPGLGAVFTAQYAKGPAAFAACGGAQGEIGLGWYYYTWLAAEVGAAPLPIALDITAAGGNYQRIAYQVRSCPTILVAAGGAEMRIPAQYLTIRRGDTWRQRIRHIGNLEGRIELWFTVKTEQEDTLDTQAVIMISETGGLLRLNGAAAATPANGSITVENAGVGNIRIYLHQVETAKLAIKSKLYYDVQVQTGTDVITLTRNARIAVVSDVTRRIE